MCLARSRFRVSPRGVVGDVATGSIASRRPSCRSGWVSALALAASAILGVSPTANGADLDPSDPAAVRSRLVVQKAGAAQDARALVILGKPAGTRDIPDYQGVRLDILPREFIRQALLIAARDGLGIATRDEVIDDTMAEKLDQPGQGGLVEVVSLIRGGKSMALIRRVADQRSETLAATETATGPGERIDFKSLLAAAEILSRDEFLKTLKTIGLEGKPNAFDAKLGLPSGIEEQLSGLGFPETLAALRALHEAIRVDGESPARLGALARAYAQLGVLSEFHWHPAHKAYKARSLLYAQRLVARNPDDPSGLWHRAFAFALLGRHQDALDDLAAASKNASAKDSPKAPTWVPLIDACARCDSRKLADEAREGSHPKLAALLRMTTLEFPRQTTVALQAAKDVVAVDPLCFRAHDSTCDYRGVATQHLATLFGPEIFVTELPRVIAGLPGLPDPAKRQLEGRLNSTAMAEALDKAGSLADDRGEPSWSALAHLVRETRFVQVYRRLYFLRYMLVVNAGDYWNEVVLEVSGHRYRPYLDTLVFSPQETARPFDDFVDQLDLTAIESTALQMTSTMFQGKRPKGRLSWTFAQCHDDETAGEIAGMIGSVVEKSRPALAHTLLAVSPQHPDARAVLIRSEWDQVKDQAATWEQESGDSPAVLAALATRYSAERRYDDARRVLGNYIQKSPDRWAYQQLAAIYKAEGRMDRWQSTLDAYLTSIEDPGLDHAQVRVEIAEYFMGLGQWAKARPYAEDAAETWAEWAMLCAARCAEGEKDWDRAETWYSRSAERYPNNSWAAWYLFCKRTGQGHLPEARAFAEQYMAAAADRPDLVLPETPGFFHWSDGNLAKAKANFIECFEKRTSIIAALALAQIADDENDAARRDQILKDLCANHKAKAPRSIAICQSLVETIFAEGGPKPTDLAGLKRQIDDFPESGRGNAEFFLAWFLKNHGELEAAKGYFKDAVESKQTAFWYRLMSSQALKQLSKE